MWRMKMSDNKLSIVLTGEEGGKNMRYMRCWHITLKTLTCTLHWFCEKSYEERHIEHFHTLGGRRWVHAVLSTQGFAKEDAAKHIYGFVSFDKYSHCEAAPNRLQASPSIGPWIKHIKPVLILLRPDPRKPETLLQPGYIWLYTLKSVESLGKRLSTCRWVLRPPPGPSRGGVIHCE